MKRFGVVSSWLVVLCALLNPLPMNIADAARDTPVRIAVLGDSDSHSYQDKYSFPPGTSARGGIYRAATLQWTEVLMALRPAQLDLGPWGEWGQRRPIAQLREWLGIASRSPKKEDYLYNLAYSGMVCDNLTTGIFSQAPRLVELIRQRPENWRNGIVVIRMGINDIGTHDMLELISVDPAAPLMVQRCANCAARISEAVHMLRAIQPRLRFVIVGPFNDTDDPSNLTEWHSAQEQTNLKSGFSHLTDRLRAMAAADPAILDWDDNRWFHARWGERDTEGKPNYRAVRIGSGLEVTNSVGDEPVHSVLNDLHAGLIWNTLWAQSLVEALNTAWHLGIPEITDDEVVRFIEHRLNDFPPSPAPPRG